MVEDNADHAVVATQALADVNASIKLHTVDNSEKCMACLNHQMP